MRNCSQSSEAQRRINYTDDRDSEAFKGILGDAQSRADLTVCRKECIGRVQKRVGARLRNLKKTPKSFGEKGKRFYPRGTRRKRPMGRDFEGLLHGPGSAN